MSVSRFQWFLFITGQKDKKIFYSVVTVFRQNRKSVVHIPFLFLSPFRFSSTLFYSVYGDSRHCRQISVSQEPPFGVRSVKSRTLPKVGVQRGTSPFLSPLFRRDYRRVEERLGTLPIHH